MTQEEFEKRLLEMFMPEPGDPDYRHKKAEAENLIKAALYDTTEFAGGVWRDEVAAERFKQWEWLQGELHNPESVRAPETTILPESKLHSLYADYLKEREYTASKIPERDGKRTPDFRVKGNSFELLNEFKAPELKFNDELGVYKFHTTHSKILTFISKAVKQLKAEDGAHEKPWVVTLASTHFQLNWKSCVDTLQGGVAFDNKLSPDFTNTDMFKRAIDRAKEIDVYVWLQVNPDNKYIYQVSFIVNKNSKFLGTIEQFVADMKAKDVSSMDNVISIEWPTQ